MHEYTCHATIVHSTKQKVRLVMDYLELNEYVDVYIASADVCAQKLREWQQQGSNIALLDLCQHTWRSTLTNLCGHSKWWRLRGKDIASTPWDLGWMWHLKSCSSSSRPWSDRLKLATVPRLHTLMVYSFNKSICFKAHVKVHLEQFGLTSKNPELLKNGTCVLGFHVWEEHRRLPCWHEGELPTAPNVLTCRSIFSVWEINRAFTSVWLAPCCNQVVRHRVSTVTIGWDDEVQNPLLCWILV